MVEPYGWGTSVSNSGEIHLRAVKAVLRGSVEPWQLADWLLSRGRLRPSGPAIATRRALERDREHADRSRPVIPRSDLDVRPLV